jgi:hypothetical protein
VLPSLGRNRAFRVKGSDSLGYPIAEAEPFRSSAVVFLHLNKGCPSSLDDPDELDEDHRRADAILQERLDLERHPESVFFWLFCQRVRGIRPNLAAKQIDFNLAFEKEDTATYGPVPGGRMRHFVAFSADKLAKINRERVYVNRKKRPELCRK